MSRNNVLTTGAEKKTAYIQNIKQTKPKDVENSGAIVRVGNQQNIIYNCFWISLLLIFFHLY